MHFFFPCVAFFLQVWGCPMADGCRPWEILPLAPYLGATWKISEAIENFQLQGTKVAPAQIRNGKLEWIHRTMHVVNIFELAKFPMQAYIPVNVNLLPQVSGKFSSYDPGMKQKDGDQKIFPLRNVQIHGGPAKLAQGHENLPPWKTFILKI